MASLSGPIVVAGDIAVDWLTWTHQDASPALDPDDNSPNWTRQQITRRVARAGGAMLLARMLTCAAENLTIRALYDPATWQPQNSRQFIESYVDLGKVTKGRFDIAQLRGFSGPAIADWSPDVIPFAAEKPGVLVLDDAGNGFRKLNQPALARWGTWLENCRPAWLVLKLGRPLGRAGDGELWDRLRPRRLKEGERPLIDANRLVVIINADDLRDHGIKLTPRLSWERTAEDFVRNIGANGKLVTLTNCHHLLIRFGCEAVIHYRFDRRDESSLYFDPRQSEGDIVASTRSAPMMGLTAAFTASIAADIHTSGTFEPKRAIPRAMGVAARLAVQGFRLCNGEPDYCLPPVFKPAEQRNDAEKLIDVFRVTIPTRQISKEPARPWRILENRGETAELARHVALRGVEAALGAPIARHGDLVTADRREIEAIRAIRNLLDEYIHTPAMKKPLSIAVFGPPGSGKSFTVKQLAKGLLPNLDKRPPLEFNLSQFIGLPHLIGAFRLVQDRILATEIPLVFFDEFDSSLEGSTLGWLKYFLAPMHDGEFRDGEATHPLGRAIFVFAGGTRTSFRQFSQPLEVREDDVDEKRIEQRTDFINAKGPDFLSRLRGHVDILGVADNGNNGDHSWPIRRAILFRFALKQRAPALFANPEKNSELAIDEGVLRAFLTVPNFVHGARSIEAILDMCRLSHMQRFTPSCLPARDQLALHVDADAFMDRVRLEQLPEPLREDLAIRIHYAYRDMRRALAAGDPVKLQELANDASMAEWNALSPDLRNSNYQQAGAIPGRLRSLGMYLARNDPAKDDQEVQTLPADEIERLAEAEHERFVEERLAAGWAAGEQRDSRSSRTPFLVPWCDVPEEYKEYDRETIRRIPALLSAVGYRVYRMPEIERQPEPGPCSTAVNPVGS